MTASSLTWRVIGASVIGTSHLRMGRGCDDAHAYRLCDNNILLLAVADGAGSASHSAKGAATAAQVVLDSAEQSLTHQGEPVQQEQWQDILSTVISAAHDALEKLAEEEQLSSRDFATTLLVTIVTQQWIAAAQIGDGAIVKQSADGAVVSLTSADRRMHINETSFVTDPEYLAQARYTVLPREELRGLALLTDGLQLLALSYPENTAHRPFFQPLFRFAGSSDATVDELRSFLESERVCARTDDDKTLLLAVCQ